MNRDRFEGGWKQFGGIVKELWGRLAGNRAAVLAGMAEQRAGRVQVRYGVLKEQARRQLKDFLDRNRGWNPSNR